MPQERSRKGDEVDILIEATQWLQALPQAEAVVARAANATIGATVERATVEREIGAPGHCAILLSDDAELRALNRRFRGQDKATNVLSFPAQDLGPQTPEHLSPIAGDDQPIHWGDVAIAYETTAGEAAAAGKTLADHLSHLVVHGLLHLFGYDHETDEAAEEMESLEREILWEIGVDDPYREESVTGDRPATGSLAR